MEGTPRKEENQVTAQPTGIDASVVFGNNRHFAFIYKKTERLVTAVYMITNFIKDNEPLKWNIREKALALMAHNISLSTVSLSDRLALLREYRAFSLEIVSLSSVAYHAGLVSEMNFNILSREFSNLLSVIENDQNKRANEETVVLDPGFFDTPAQRTEQAAIAPAAPAAPAPAPARTEKMFYKGQAEKPSAPSIDMSFTTAPAQASKPEYLPMKEAREKAVKVVDSKDSRQSTILKLLSKKSGLSIKDFAGTIKGVSEKTIQRELLAMVASGVLKKEGERRWSTYSLAK